MKNFLIISIIFIFFSQYATAEVCNLRYISDGDTIKCEFNGDLIGIRLANIDAPEKLQEFGLESKEILINLIKPFTKIEFNMEKKDRYGRYVSEIFINGLNLNVEMVKKGGAWVYTEYLEKDKNHVYLTAEANARKLKIGLWKNPKPIYPSNWRKNKKKSYTKQIQNINSENKNFICQKKTCSKIKSCEEAYFLLKNCGLIKLDANKNGIPCEKLCK